MFALLWLLLEQTTQSSVPSPQSSDVITVTATRTAERLADTPASVVILDRQAIAATAAPTVDDALRQVPGFSLFRRAGSRTANPTAQGASLRGLGGSGTGECNKVATHQRIRITTMTVVTIMIWSAFPLDS